ATLFPYTTLFRSLTEWKDRAVDWLRELWSSFKRWIGEILPDDVRTWFETAKTGAIKKLTEWKDEAIRKAGEVAQGIVDGIRKGIAKGWTKLTTFVSTKARDLLDAAKRALGIASPSKVFRDEVGKWIPAGISEGIIKNAKVATDAVKGLSGDLVSAGELPAGMSSGAYGASQRGLSARQSYALERLVSLMEQDALNRQRRSQGDVHVHLEQTSGSPAETGRMVALALRTVG